MVFRRREPLHERLAREGGLVPPPPHDPGPHWGEVGIHGLHRPREWDAVATVRTELPGDVVRFVALPDGTLLVEEGDEDVDPGVLADAVEAEVRAPYRAEAVHRGKDVWAVAARGIDVVEIADDPGGDVVQLVWNGAERTLLVDGVPSLARVRELEALAPARAEAYVIDGERLDGALWEIRRTLL
jgi:hypothetical protein